MGAFRSSKNQIEMVLLIDGAARNSLGRQMNDIALVYSDAAA